MTACWTYLLVACAACIFMRTLGDRMWLATFLLFAPRWPFAVPAVLLLPWAIFARRWGLTAMVLASAAVVAFPLMGLRPAVSVAEAKRGNVRLLTFNVHRKQVDVARLLAFIADVQPDVIALQDWSSSLEQPLFGDGQWHRRQVGELFVASRFPIGEVTPIAFDDSDGAPKAERGAAAVFELTLPRGSIYLVNVHLASPHTALNALVKDRGSDLSRNAERRWGQSDMVRAIVDGIGRPAIVTGDFNTTWDSPIFREHWDDFDNAFTERGRGLGYTYLNDHTQFRIDHVLTDAAWEPLGAWIGPEAGSPHRPLIADLELR